MAWAAADPKKIIKMAKTKFHFTHIEAEELAHHAIEYVERNRTDQFNRQYWKRVYALAREQKPRGLIARAIQNYFPERYAKRKEAIIKADMLLDWYSPRHFSP
jgi:short-subunit dehydrogenase